MSHAEPGRFVRYLGQAQFYRDYTTRAEYKRHTYSVSSQNIYTATTSHLIARLPSKYESKLSISLKCIAKASIFGGRQCSSYCGTNNSGEHLGVGQARPGSVRVAKQASKNECVYCICVRIYANAKVRMCVCMRVCMVTVSSRHSPQFPLSWPTGSQRHRPPLQVRLEQTRDKEKVTTYTVIRG